MANFVLPEAVESERVVLGSVLIEGVAAMKKIAHIITYRDFYDNNHRLIFRAMEKLYQDQRDIDVITVTEELKMRNYLESMGGATFVMELTSDIATTAHVVTHARTIADRATLRRIIQAAHDIAQMSQEDEDLDALLNKAEERLKGVTRSAAQAENRLAIVDLEDWRQIARDTQPREGEVRGLSLGYKSLDTMTEGFEAGEMMVLTGHTKHGKSQLATNIAYNVAQRGGTVLFINTEMMKIQLARRFNMLAGQEPLKGKIILNDRADITYLDAIHIIERAKERGCDLVIVDHLHYFSRSVDNQTNEISKITKDFKEAAVQYEVPLLLLCHVQQADTKKFPTIQMLKNSSSIAQDSDLVLAIWLDDRPNAPMPDERKIIRLVHRSSSQNNRMAALYSDGFKLTETPTAPPKYDYDPNVQLGEKNEDIDLEGW